MPSILISSIPVFAVFVLSTFPLLVGAGGGLVCESSGKADLLSDHFDGVGFHIIPIFYSFNSIFISTLVHKIFLDIITIIHLFNNFF